MNTYYRLILMLFLNGAGAAIYFIAIGKEIIAKVPLNTNLYVPAAAALVAGYMIAYRGTGGRGKPDVPRLNLIITLSAIAGVFTAITMLFLARYYREFFGVKPEQELSLLLRAAMPLIVYAPVSALFFAGLAASEALSANDKVIPPGFHKIMTTIGLATGAGIYALFLNKYFSDIELIYYYGLLVMAACYMLFRGKSMEGRYTMLAVIISAVLLLVFGMSPLMEKKHGKTQEVRQGAASDEK